MKIKITGCHHAPYWYAKAIGVTIDCLYVNEIGEAVIIAEIVDQIDGTTDGAAGMVENGDFMIVQEDNIQPQS